jgi:D-amino-acid dehydrogenase
VVVKLAGSGETETDYEVVGGLVVGQSDGQLDAFVERLELLLDRGLKEIGEVRFLGSGGPEELFPYLNPGLAGVFLSGAARVSGEMFRAASLCQAAIQGRHYTAVGGGRSRSLRRRCCRRSHGRRIIPSDTVVVVAGAWSTELCRPLGLELALEPQRGQIMHLRLPGADTGTLPIVLPALSDYYLIGFPDSRIVIGATRESEAGFDFRITAGGVAEVLQEGLRVAPGSKEATLAEIRVGFRPLSKDGLPLLGRVPSISGLVIATGLGPYGLTVGPYVGSLAAQLAVGPPCARIDRV